MTNTPRPAEEAGAELHPAEELARLAAGLGAVLDRRRRSGHRGLPRLGAAVLELPPAPLPAAPQAPGRPAPASNSDRGEVTTPRGKTGESAERSAQVPRPAHPAPARETAAGAPAARPERSPAPTASTAPSGTAPSEPSAPAKPAPRRSSDAAALEAALTANLSERHKALFLAKREEVRSAARAARDLGELAERVAACRACRLCEGRTQTVFSDGAATARVMFVGEGPGAEEDRTGVPFVGAAGQLLSGIIEKGMQLSRANDVYIANVVKCRPPENRDPTPQEKAICSAWLDRQIELVDPAVIVPLGSHAAGRLLRSAAGIGRLRGRVHQLDGRKLVPTYHPAYVLRQSGPELAAVKAKVWDDIRLAMAELGL